MLGFQRRKMTIWLESWILTGICVWNIFKNGHSVCTCHSFNNLNFVNKNLNATNTYLGSVAYCI